MKITVIDGTNACEAKDGTEARAMLAEIVEREKQANQAILDQKKKDKQA